MVQTYDEINDPKDVRNNRLLTADKAVHSWYRFILSFPPQLVRGYIQKFGLTTDAVILDPFCGTGTTIVEAKKNLIPAIGVEAAPMAHFASMVKTTWSVDGQQLQSMAEQIAERALAAHAHTDTLKTLSPQQAALLLANSICEVPLHKCLLLHEAIQQFAEPEYEPLLQLALAFTAVNDASNLRFAPEVSISRKRKRDADVIAAWLTKIAEMVADLAVVQTLDYPPSYCHRSDSRRLDELLEPESIDAIITSPPYPNEKDYTRTTRLESVLLGFLATKQDLKQLKQGLLRSNSRNIYVRDRDDRLIDPNGSVAQLADEIDRRRLAWGKTSGFARQYPHVTRLYFGGMKRHLASLRPALKPGAKLAYVVGDQASFLQVLIRTGELLAEIAQEVGYEVKEIDLFRTRLSSATGDQLREEVLVLEWPGYGRSKVRSACLSGHVYDPVFEAVFWQHYREGSSEVAFSCEDLEQVSQSLNLELPTNWGDLIYAYRYRRDLPKSIRQLLSPGEEWIIRSVGRGQYQFVLSENRQAQTVY